MNIILDIVVVAASVVGAGMALPQAITLLSTRSTDGVSPMWIGVSLAINAWWIVYAIAASIWVLLPVATTSFALYASMAVLFVRARRSLRSPMAPVFRSMLAGSFGLGLAPLPALVFGNWATAGIAIGLSYGLQLLPAVVAASRTRQLSGVSSGTWILSLVEGALWLVYGAAIGDGALIAGGVTGVVMSGLLLARLEATGHRPFVFGLGGRTAFAR